MTGIGFPDRKPVAAGDAVKEGQETHTLQYRYRRALWLVGADRGAVAAIAQRPQGFRHTGIRSRQPRRIRLVNFEKARQRRDRFGGIGAAGGKGARDEHRHAVADHVLHLRGRQPSTPALAQHLVERGAQIRHAVDKRAVEIEDEKKALHKRNFALL